MLSQLVTSATERVDLEEGRERFRLSTPTREVPVFADRELILTALSQLVDNALKYSEPGSPIDVRVAAEDRETILTIRTRGLVVDSRDCDRIFERFYRAPEVQHLPAGTGLGLSIVKRIVGAHHGRVWATGEADFGTAFSVALPVAPTK
jgi:signal transduction histidine kinase